MNQHLFYSLPEAFSLGSFSFWGRKRYFNQTRPVFLCESFSATGKQKRFGVEEIGIGSRMSVFPYFACQKVQYSSCLFVDLTLPLTPQRTPKAFPIVLFEGFEVKRFNQPSFASQIHNKRVILLTFEHKFTLRSVSWCFL